VRLGKVRLHYNYDVVTTLVWFVFRVRRAVCVEILYAPFAQGGVAMVRTTYELDR
jgi:hypothetical protein